ncbi:hypothetical protein F511_18804 [Dorcoceras hygrometricum]|uniref:Uncharacterized protein n=1 Tax=Dorcoceras hygrometricum TaxID=472368 RepID=A0A2Z7CA95_9LAMI|nr:hypothetical protein F511_18804 [Dorcoceras hygrometricum]
MEASFEEEDDLFFADLSKQISLLIMDDDGEDSLVHCPSTNLHAFSQEIIIPSTQATLLVGHDQQSHIRRVVSKGTGVFIPRSMSNPRRNNNTKQGRFNANHKYQRPTLDYHNEARGIVPQLKYNSNNVKPSYDPRRFGV